MGLLSNLIIVGVSLYSFFFMRKVVKERSDGPLTKDEKFTVIATLIFTPLISYFIYYLGWKDKLPQKAQQVKSYLWKIILALVLIAVIAFGIALLLSAF